MKKISKSKKIIILCLFVVLLTTISLINANQKKTDTILPEALISDQEEIITVTKTTKYSDSSLSIKFNSKTNEILNVEENGVQVNPAEYGKYKDTIAQIKKDVHEQKALEIKRDEFSANMDAFIQKANDYLKTKGYQTEKAAFYMKFKNNWHLNFSDKAYLNKKKLPANITAELFKLYNETTKNQKTLIISLPDGLAKINVENYRLNVTLKG